MNILEFIRRNSIIVLIAIAGVGVGLVVMDYAGSGSVFSRDYYIKVNDVAYSYPEMTRIGSNGSGYLSQLLSAAHSKMVSQFDLDENEKLDDAESAKQAEWLAQNPDFEDFVDRMNQTRWFWSFGGAGREEDNVGINRAIIQAEGEALGIKPSPEQIDTYIQAMPIFRKDDGSFDTELYRRFCGLRGSTSSSQERAFRELVSDLITWEALCSFYTANVSAHPGTMEKFADVLSQRISGRSAWLPEASVLTPAEPTEDELKAFWETTKNNYLTDEQRVITLYTLKADNGAMDDRVGDEIMEKLSMANGKGISDIIKAAAENPENEPFTFAAETFELTTLTGAPEGLKLSVPYKGGATTLAEIAFKEVKEAPALEAYQAAASKGTQADLVTIKQIRGYYRTRDGQFVILCVNASQQPTVMTYEQAHQPALQALKKQRSDNALSDAAQKLYDEMTATLKAEGLDAAFAKASAAGATVENFGPVSLETASGLPQGVSTQALVTVPTQTLAPLQVTEGSGASITAVTARTYEDSEEYRAMRKMLAMQLNMQLRDQVVILDWLQHAYKRYNVLLSKDAARKD